MKNLICPYCKTEAFVTPNAYYNAEAYGSRTFDFPCDKCGEMICVTLHRIVEAININKSKKKIEESDF